MRLRLGLLLVMLGVVMAGVQESPAAAKLREVRIGTVADGPSKQLDAISLLMQREILDLTRGEFKVRFPAKKQLNGGWSVGGVKSAVNRLLADRKVDLVIAVGVIASNDLSLRKRLRKPVIAPFILDAELQGLPFKKGASGVTNLSYVASFTSLERDVKAFTDIMPFKHLAMLVDQSILKAFPLIKQKTGRIARANNITIQIVPVGTTIEPAMAALPKDTDAVFLTPLLRINPKEFDGLVSALITRRLPSFSLKGKQDVERGVLAGVSPQKDDLRLARRVALNVQRILLGTNAGDIPVNFPLRERLRINMATVRAIDKWPSFRVLTEAQLLQEEEAKMGRRISLYTAVREAVSVSPDLAATDRFVAAQMGTVLQKRSALLPQIDIGTRAVQINPDLATGTLPLAERSAFAAGSAKQLIYADDAWAGYTVEQRNLEARKELRRKRQLDIAQDAAVSYLNVLKAKTTERIQKDNLELTRTNLELARVRVSVGYARRDEVFRWQSEIANARIRVLDAQAQRKQAKVALNRLLNRPLEEPFVTQEAGLDDPLLLTSEQKLFAYVDNPRYAAVFRDFEVQEGLKASPEIARLDAKIAGSKRKVLNAQRSFWLPDASVGIDVLQRYAKGGETGGGGGSFLPGIGLIPAGEDVNTFWFATLDLVFPLYQGGAKDATQLKEGELLRRFRLRREAVVGNIEKNIRSALFQAGASFPSIRLAREAAEAARKNYEMVVDQYRRGQVDIIKLADTQTTALNANLTAANATYNFLIDLSNIQRAVGQFDYFMYADERTAWFGRLKSHFAREGITAEKP